MDENFLRGKPQSEQAGYIWKFLDELARSDPEKYNQFIKKTLEDGERQGMGPPSHSFVIKTQKVPKVIPLREFFINACKWKQVPTPESDFDPIKIIAGELREEVIQERVCYVVDVAVNPGVMEHCMKVKEEKCLLIELIIRYIEAALTTKLDRDFKIINDDYKGNRDNLLDMMCPETLKQSVKTSSKGISEGKLLDQLKRVEIGSDDKGKGIEIEKSDRILDKNTEILLPTQVQNEMFLAEENVSNKRRTREESLGQVKNKERSDDLESKRKIKGRETDYQKVKGPVTGEQKVKSQENEKEKVKGVGTGSLRKPKFIERSEVKGEKSCKVIEIDLPGVSGMKDCELDVGEDFLELLVPGKYHINLKWDKKIDDEETEAFFIRKNNLLVGDLENDLRNESNINIPVKWSTYSQIAKAMEYLSAYGIIHQDLAFRNCILTSENCHVKVAFFSISEDLFQED